MYPPFLSVHATRPMGSLHALILVILTRKPEWFALRLRLSLSIPKKYAAVSKEAAVFSYVCCFFYAPYFAKFVFSEVMPRLFLCGNLLPSLSLLAFFNANLQDLMQDAAFSFANIAQRQHKSDSTISREIIRNRYQV